LALALSGPKRFGFPVSVKECLSELLGTYILVFIGSASVVTVSLFSYLSSIEALTLVALVFGFTVASIIVALGRHSGAHINPAITVASAVAATSKRHSLAPYIAFQLAGALFAGLSLKLLFRGLAPSAYLGSTRLGAGVSPVEGVTLETLGTFVLAITALSASSFFTHPVKQAALVGTTLFALIIVLGPLTGASFNPSRSMGPSIFSGYHTNQAVYWIGPLLGALFAGSLFRLVKESHDRS